MLRGGLKVCKPRSVCVYCPELSGVLVSRENLGVSMSIG